MAFESVLAQNLGAKARAVFEQPLDSGRQVIDDESSELGVALGHLAYIVLAGWERPDVPAGEREGAAGLAPLLEQNDIDTLFGCSERCCEPAEARSGDDHGGGVGQGGKGGLHGEPLYDIFYFVRFVRFKDGGSVRLGALADGGVADLSAAGLPTSVEDLLRSGADWQQRATDAMSSAVRVEQEVQLLSPVARPSKILCLGMNFRSHSDEVGVDGEAEEPTVFSKLASSLTGPSDPIVLPSEAPDRVDYEAELAVVIGRGGRDIPVERAADWVAGYTVANDVSARDWQLKKPLGQWLLGKSFDTFLPFGPAVVTSEESPAPDEMVVRCVVSGEVLQEASVADLIVGIPEAISYVSRVCTLEPGDVILTGTPGGVGMARKPRRFLGSGDVVETSVSGIGVLRNPVTTAAAA